MPLYHLCCYLCKCYVLVATQTLMHCLVYLHLFSGSCTNEVVHLCLWSNYVMYHCWPVLFEVNNCLHFLPVVVHFEWLVALYWIHNHRDSVQWVCHQSLWSKHHCENWWSRWVTRTHAYTHTHAHKTHTHRIHLHIGYHYISDKITNIDMVTQWCNDDVIYYTCYTINTAV